VRYGISEIDNNFELKKFLVQQDERRLSIKNKLQYDINQFMGDLVKMKEGKGSKTDEMASQVATRGKKRQLRNIANKFTRAHTQRLEDSSSRTRNQVAAA
jgi:hypothetical protein